MLQLATYHTQQTQNHPRANLYEMSRIKEHRQLVIQNRGYPERFYALLLIIF